MDGEAEICEVRSALDGSPQVVLANRKHRTEKQLNAPTALPLTLIPIRIDLDIPSYTPHPALPLPPEYHALNINPALPAYRTPEPTPAYRLKDIFLWNLHETLMTPDQFATILIHDLDLPNSSGLAMQVSKQIREQLEEYAGVALHPLFHSTDTGASNGIGVKTIQAARSRDQSSTPAPIGPGTPKPSTPKPSSANGTNGYASPAKEPAKDITATATPHPAPNSGSENDPDDTYRCIVNLNINLQNKLYTDKFEWSLLHPVGMAERFAKQTCADIGLSGEWVPAMAHAIYEAVLRLKKEACENGGLVGTMNGYGGEIDNMAANGAEAGWRFDNEHLADEWEPKIERLSKEEIEKREGDRERQLRRLRRETARFSSTTNMAGGMPQTTGYDNQGDETPAMGRGERSKKKKRFRSLSPLARASPDVGNAGYGGGGAGSLNDWERQTWRCAHCLVHGSAVWAVRDGPNGPRVCFPFLLCLLFLEIMLKEALEANIRKSPYAATAASPSSATSASPPGPKISITLTSRSGAERMFHVTKSNKRNKPTRRLQYYLPISIQSHSLPFSWRERERASESALFQVDARTHSLVPSFLMWEAKLLLFVS